MQPLSVVVAHKDINAAARLAATLHTHFRSVSVARTLDEVRTAIPRHRANLAVVDLELVSVNDVEQLTHEFESVQIVCTHRLPDEQMWTDALGAGAVDVCQSNDVDGIVFAAQRNLAIGRSNAA